MNELRLAKRDWAKKNQGEGRVPLPLKRKAERERIEQKTRGGEYVDTIRTRLDELPPLARKYVIENEGGMMLTDTRDRDATPEELRDLEGQVGELRREREAERDARIAADVDAKATSLMNVDPSLDYGAAVRVVAASDGRFARAEEPAEGGDYEEQLKQTIQRRGYDLD